MKTTDTPEVTKAFLEAADIEADSVVIAFSADRGSVSNKMVLTDTQKELAVCAILKPLGENSMKITASLVAKKEWSTSCTRDSEEDFEGAFSDRNFDLTIANVIADLLYMSKYQIANLEYIIACIVSDVLDPGHQEYDEETHELSSKLYLAANELIAHIEACHEARQQK